jgi:uncharacterized protein (UPF0332 family)
MDEVRLQKIIAKTEGCLGSSKDSYERKRLELCINRAYFAMFHSVKALMLTRDIHSKTHAEVHGKFRKFHIETDRFSTSLSERLQRSFVKKQFVDYCYEEVSEDQAIESIEDAEQFVKATLTYLKENNYLK